MFGLESIKHWHDIFGSPATGRWSQASGLQRLATRVLVRTTPIGCWPTDRLRFPTGRYSHQTVAAQERRDVLRW